MKLSKRWAPAVISPAVVAAVALNPLQANAVDLPDLTPEELMVMMQQAQPVEFSGTVLKTSNLGLPALELSSMLSESEIEQMREKTPEEFASFVPDVIENNALTEAMELIAGEHRIRVYVGETGVRSQILDPMAQRDFIASGNTVWVYDSREQTAAYAEIDEAQAQASKDEAMLRLDGYAAEIGLDLTNPQAVAEYAMAQVGDSSQVSVGTDHYYAGRTAYELIITPNSDVSLIASVVISLDSEFGIPLAVTVNSTEQAEPAMQIGFESISFQDQDESLFSFTPPAGTTVTNLNELGAQAKDMEMFMSQEEMAELEEKSGAKPEPTMIGDSWDTVIHMPASDSGELGILSEGLFAELMSDVDGGKVFSTPVMNVLVTDSGDIYAGAVTVAHLLAVAK
jgi:outer membrane lipoprotein-sorting protein